MTVSPDDLLKSAGLPPVAAVVVGLVLLAAGRRLFWLFVAVMGFIVGTELATGMFPQQSGMVLISGAILGILGAILALLVQKIAVGVGGFLAGGYFLVTLLRASALHTPQYSWIAFLIGGIAGAILMIYVFNWALIIFSSAIGAHLIVYVLPVNQSTASVVGVVLIIVGCVVQARLLKPKK